MEFLKKNWSKIIVAAITGILGVLFLISIFTPLEKGSMSGLDLLDIKQTTVFLTYVLIPALFFLGTCAYIVLKLLDLKNIGKYILLGAGAINLILFIIAMIDGGFPGVGLGDLMIWAQVAIFALIPLVKGLKKVFCCCERETAVVKK